MRNQEILEYTQINYPNEHDLIGRSLINFYSLRLKGKKDELQELQQEMIYDSVIELFELLSMQISLEFNIDKDIVFDKLKEIYIKS